MVRGGGGGGAVKTIKHAMFEFEHDLDARRRSRRPSNLEAREARSRRSRSPLPALHGTEGGDELSQLIENMKEGELSTLRASLDDTMELGQLSMEEEAVKFSQRREEEQEEGGRQGSKREQGGSGLSKMVRMEEASPSRSLRRVVLDVEQCKELHMSLRREGQEEEEGTEGERRGEGAAREKDRSGEEGKRKEEENKADANTEESSDVHQDPPSPPLDQDMQGSLRQHAQLVSDSFLRDKFEGSPFIDKLLEEDASRPLGDSSFPSFCDLLQRVAAECSLTLTFSSSSPPPPPPRSDDQGLNTILSSSAGSPARGRRKRESLGGGQVGMQVERLLEVKQADYELYRLSILSGLVQSGPPSIRHPSPASSRRQKSIDEVEKQVR
ncbi:hypothetical protein GUITHDRAFT_136194 [Guillardia theta CCMP2712]|uniref:Uncharacterized protein n=1 Tax=Guillardia theta (strain CCMP2712) TaxID=905079 RepID=L1JLK9_GUITC|nr:hypothetical protein GUITHDRAFT_136194 [Guillardia theta CCMP2712]EKX49005.1 hypothetical protein GUITHDRAFT_136194 [Guillardia theta CCMP2712]|eukprot:XP_005835985.1 hypothetical protein GUITHDRAFT_136194 [Guillardia theta CCMP2712]